MVESGKCTALVFFCTCVYMLRFAMERICDAHRNTICNTKY